AALLYIPGLSWGLPSEVHVATDSEAPYDSIEFVALYRDPDVANKYPDVQPLLALPVYGAVVLANKISGDLTTISTAWPYGFRDPYRVFSEFILARNAMSLMMGIGVLVTLTKLHLPSL